MTRILSENILYRLEMNTLEEDLSMEIRIVDSSFQYYRGQKILQHQVL